MTVSSELGCRSTSDSRTQSTEQRHSRTMAGVSKQQNNEIAFAAATPAVARSALHGRPLRCVRPKTTSVVRTPARGAAPRMASLSSVMEAISRRGLLNNAITAGFIGAALWVLFTPVKTSGVATPNAAKLADPAEGKVTSKVFFDLAIGGAPAGRIVLGTCARRARAGEVLTTVQACSATTCRKRPRTSNSSPPAKTASGTRIPSVRGPPAMRACLRFEILLTISRLQFIGTCFYRRDSVAIGH